MKVDEALNLIKPELSEERYDHTLRVIKVAMKLATLYGGEENKIELAAAFHDYAKNRPLAEMKRQILASSLPRDLLQYHPELWHGPVASLLIESQYGITDPAIQSAIRYHTTGKAHMKKIEMIICLADYIEPERNFPGLNEVRKMAEQDLVRATWMVIRNTIHFLTHKKRRIYPDTFHAYNHLSQFHK